MGVSSVGATAVQRKPIVYPSVEIYSTTITTAQVGTFNYTGRVVPAGWWDMQTIFAARPNGFISSGSTSYADVHPDWVQFYSVATGKIIQTISAPGTLGKYGRTTGPFYLPEDCYINILTVDTTGTSSTLDVTFYPVDMPELTFEGSSSLLDSTNTTPTSSDTNISFASFAYNSQIGFVYDYDNDSLAIITTPNTPNLPGGGIAIASVLNLYRRPAGSTTYSNKVTLTLSSTNSYWSPQGYSGVDISYGLSEFFIKNNELHMLSGTPIFDNGTTVSGWAKVDCSTTGTKTLALGNADLNFHATKSTFSYIGSPIKSLMYTHDLLNKKVIYLGFHNNTGSDSTKWSSYWSQWDIVNNTNNYTSSLGNKHKYVGSNASGIYGWVFDAYVPDGATTRAYAIRRNGSAPGTCVVSYFIRSSNTVSTVLPTKIYSNANDSTTPVTTATGASYVDAGFTFYSPAGVLYGGARAIAGPIVAACPEMLSKTTASELTNDINITFRSDADYGYARWSTAINSGFSLTIDISQKTGFYFAGSKIYIVYTGTAIGVRNSTPVYSGNGITRVFSMPATEANILKIAKFRGGIKSATSNFNIR